MGTNVASTHRSTLYQPMPISSQESRKTVLCFLKTAAATLAPGKNRITGVDLQALFTDDGEYLCSRSGSQLHR